MKILIAGLVYGPRTLEVLIGNLSNLNYDNADFVAINTEGVANAMNEAIDIAGVDGYDAIAYLANDIVEPKDWLNKKVKALKYYPQAGIVASSLDRVRVGVNSEHIISNWLLSMKVVEQIGIFNESMFPYGPIDLDYCERANLAGFNTYYVKDCLAEHLGGHATGDEYGYNKAELLQKNWAKHEADIKAYRDGSKPISIWK
jgi:GT2 family glycosyltransferase